MNRIARGFLLAPITGGMSVPIGIILLEWVHQGHPPDLGSVAIFLVIGLVASCAAYVVALLLGLPLLALFLRCRLLQAPVFVVGGYMAALLACAILAGRLTPGLLLLALPGAVGGLVFWLIAIRKNPAFKSGVAQEEVPC